MNAQFFIWWHSMVVLKYVHKFFDTLLQEVELNSAFPWVWSWTWQSTLNELSVVPGMVDDSLDQDTEDILVSSLPFFLWDMSLRGQTVAKLCRYSSNSMASPCSKELRPPANSHVRVPSWKQVLQPQGSLQMRQRPSWHLDSDTMTGSEPEPLVKLFLRYEYFSRQWVWG